MKPLRIALSGLIVVCVVHLSTAVAMGATESKGDRAKLYDTSADGNQQIAAALKTAKAEQKRVLLKFGANW